MDKLEKRKIEILASLEGFKKVNSGVKTPNQKSHFVKSTTKRLERELDSVNISIEKLQYNQKGVLSVLRKSGLKASKKTTTAIRGYSTYSKGYELDNKYSVNFIKLHQITDAEKDALNKSFLEAEVLAVAKSDGIVLAKNKLDFILL